MCRTILQGSDDRMLTARRTTYSSGTVSEGVFAMPKMRATGQRS